jgi:DHA1 family bicyclomycin/chloramphenicol resistance-like MFS transporter
MPELATPPVENPPRQTLGEFGILALLALLSAFIPLSTDMYLPALPAMTKVLHAPPSMVNLTLVLFFVFYSVGTLLWGPLSDKYGRRPVLLLGLAGYILACAWCALAPNVYHLIAARVLQALAGGAAPAMATALVKDLFAGKRRERGLVLIQAMVMIAPIVAPLIGATLLGVTTWRGIFWTLGAFGLAAFCWSLALRETVTQRYAGTLWQTWGQLGAVLRNPGFSVLLGIFSVIVMPLFCYLAASSYIYEHEYGLTEMQYSGFFTLNACVAVVAPFAYLQLARGLARRTIITLCYAVVAVAGALICTLGRQAPWLLALSIMPATLTMGIVRPPSAHLLLEQEQHAIGSASSLINCAGTLIGSLGMALMSLPWPSLILPLGLVHLTAGLLGGLLWLGTARLTYIRQPE